MLIKCCARLREHISRQAALGLDLVQDNRIDQGRVILAANGVRSAIAVDLCITDTFDFLQQAVIRNEAAARPLLIR